MYLYGFFALVAVSSFMALSNWRRGVLLMILIGALQDPIRKMTPGAPGYLVLATTPVFFAMIFNAFSKGLPLWLWFKRSHKKLSFAVTLFLISLVPGAIVSLSNGLGGGLLILIGLLSYLTLIFGWLIGNVYKRNVFETRKVLAFYCVVTSVMLIGTALEYFNLFTDWPTLGTKVLNMEWIRYSDDAIIKLIAGFYRSPDVMGWHAIVAAMLATILAVSGRGGKRFAWIVIAAWGIGMAMLCGRRKMVMMFPLFVMVFTWLYWQARRRTRTVVVAGILLGVVLLGYSVYDFMGSDTATENYYFHRMGDVPQRLNAGSYAGVVETYQQSGFFGEGLGSAATGAHNLMIERPRVWQEGGLDKLMVELGVPGLTCFLFLTYRLVRTILILVLKRLDPKSEDFALMAGLTGIFFANAGSFIVSHQIFGDPFILSFFSFLTGLLLSAGRSKENLDPSKIITLPVSEKQKYVARAAVLRSQSLPRNRR
ncbi:MAG: O-antigen ligase family protein [Thermodesulfovibrionales bacterium]